VAVDLQASTVTNTGGFSGINDFVGGGATDTLTGADVANTWTINAPNAGNVDGTTFSGFENLTGGTNTDGFTLTGTGSVSGTVNGGADAATNNTLGRVTSPYGTSRRTAATHNVNAFTNIGT
jgi:hypothetical protein